MEEQINVEKREKIKKYLLVFVFLLTAGFFFRINEFTGLNTQAQEKTFKVEYDSKGYIKMINNNGKLYNFEKGRLL